MTDEIQPAATWPHYGDLRSCPKFCFSACQEGNSSVLSRQPDKPCIPPSTKFSSRDPQTYPGLIKELQCSEVSCICGLNSWLTTVQKLYDCEVLFCHTTIGTPAIPNSDFSQSINTLTAFCGDNGYYPQDLLLDIAKDFGIQGTK
jgi:hypothetical protein